MTVANLVHLFSLNSSSGIPIYRQLIDQIKQAIRMKLLKAGDKLPSVRALATALQINPMTISKAFAQLEIEGVLLRKKGIGMMVAEQTVATSIHQEIEQPLKAFIKKARDASLDDESIIALLQQYLSIDSDKL